jgi:DNA-binding NtrC family response regulator
MRAPIDVLVVDDDAAIRRLLGSILARHQYKVVEAASGGDAMALLRRSSFDVVLVDVVLPDRSGLDVLRWVRDSDIDAELIVLTGHADVETAVEAMRLGAYDFVTKPWKNAELLEIVAKATEKKKLRRENVALKDMLTRRDGAPAIVGDSDEVHSVLALVSRVALSDRPVLIHGESGTGKELIARAIHMQSPRAGQPFVSMNCGALPDTLLETELFGHTRGAFSGAVSGRAGLFEAADGGTLFLDEIGEMSPAMQVRLLRTLDSGEVRRVGEDRTFHVDARIVAATAKDLTREAAEGRFRWDLFYRVSTVVVPVPPLRARGGDVPRLVDHFLAPFARVGKAVRFDAEAMELLRAYRWPGNVRELRNLIERLQILREGGEVRVGDLPAEFTGSAHGVRSPAPEPSTLVSLSEMERQHVERVLRATAWNKARAARILDVDIKTLNKKIRDFGLMKSA